MVRVNQSGPAAQNGNTPRTIDSAAWHPHLQACLASGPQRN